MMWKILTAQFREEIYYSLIRCRLFPEEQKECYKGTRGDALSPLQFVIAMMPQNPILRKWTGGYKLHKLQEEKKKLTSIFVHRRNKIIFQK